MIEPGTRPDITVVMATYRRADALQTQLLGLSRQDFGGVVEILVCDNEPSPRTLEIADEWAERLPGLRVIDASDGPGHGFPKNVGVINATAPLIAFCDDDDYVMPGWLTAIAKGLTEFDVVTGPLGKVPYDFDQGDPMDAAPTATFSECVIHPCGAPIATGCNSGYRREVLSQGVGEVDTITSLRATRHGYAFGWCPDAKVLYRGRQPGWAAVGRATTSGVWRVAIDREFPGMLYPEPARPWRMLAKLVLRLPLAAVGIDKKGLKWPLGTALGVILERRLPGFWWGRIAARREAGHVDNQVFTPGAGVDA